MQFSNEGLTSGPGRLTGWLDRPESDSRAVHPQSEWEVIQSATALPIAGPEHVALEGQALALVGAEALDDGGSLRAPFLPAGDRADDSFHIGEAADALAMLVGPVETERRAPIVDHEEDLLARSDHRVDE